MRVLLGMQTQFLFRYQSKERAKCITPYSPLYWFLVLVALRLRRKNRSSKAVHLTLPGRHRIFCSRDQTARNCASAITGERELRSDSVTPTVQMFAQRPSQTSRR